MRKIVLLSMVFLSACVKKSEDLLTLDWRKGDSPQTLRPLDGLDLSQKSPQKSLKESVSLQQQRFLNLPIEHSFIKEVKSGDEMLVARAAVILDQDKLKNLKIQDFIKRQPSIKEDIAKRWPFFRKSAPETIEPLIAQKNDYLELQWRVVYLRDGNLWEVRLNPNLEIRSSQRVGSQFHETAAWVFPQGPKKSTLQEVSLKDLLLKPTLSNSRVFVSSQADLNISDVEEPLKFALEDSRFDQVQVFYFLNESLNWFEKNLNFKLPMQLQAEVHMGAPEKTNSAFYYQGKIRLGQGDDEFYSRIPHDPSIVIHESVHALVEVLARLPYEGEGGSLNEAFADFFTALQIGSPHMGEAAYLKAPFRRTILNDLTLKDKNGGLYHDSGIASGTLWELGTKLGLVKGQKLALLTLNRLTPASGFSDFGKTLRSVILENTSGVEQEMALAILDKRGFAP
jgi:hypothetical protein